MLCTSVYFPMLSGSGNLCRDRPASSGFYCYNWIRVDFPLSLQWLLHFYFSMGQKGKSIGGAHCTWHGPRQSSPVTVNTVKSKQWICKGKGRVGGSGGCFYIFIEHSGLALSFTHLRFFFGFIFQCLIWLTSRSLIKISVQTVFVVCKSCKCYLLKDFSSSVKP